MTLADIRLNLYRRLNFSDTPDGAVTTRLTMFVNQRYRTLLTTPALRRLREGVGSATSVAGQPEYGMHGGMGRILAVRDRTDDRRLAPMAFDTYRSTHPDTTQQSTPTHYVPIGLRAVWRRPAGSAIWIVSGNALDTTQIATLHLGYNSPGLATLTAGLVQTVTATLNGTTRVAVAAGNLIDDVFTWSLSAVSNGQVSLYDAATGGHELGSISSGFRSARFYVFALVPTPSAARVYDIDYEHALVDLSNTWDEPLIPDDFQDLLVLGALADEFMHRDDNRYSAAVMEYRARLSDLKSWLYGHRAATQKGPRAELAPLGSWFPHQGHYPG
jgi:hypothetical protein